MAVFWVIGGTYRDTGFDRPVGAERKIGPFATFEQAEAEWSKLAWRTVDDANSRYRIDRSEQYWVEGGIFTDTTFETPEGTLERHGPFATFEEARIVWRELAWRHADDCHVRYRIRDA